MILDDVLKNPALRRVVAAGEERVGKVVGKLLSSETVTTGLQGLFTSALQARETLGRGVQQALHAANLPSREDVAALKQKLAELEATIDGLTARVAGPPAAAPSSQEVADDEEGGEAGADA